MRERSLEAVTCELCASDRSRVVLRQRDPLHPVSDDEFTVVRCDSCGLFYLNPRPTPGEIGEHYPPQYFVAQQPKSRSSLELSLKKLSRDLKQWIREDFYGYPSSLRSSVWRAFRKLALWPEHVRRVLTGREVIPWSGQGVLLDVGCGPGVNLQTFEEQGWEVYGIDASTSAVAHARERFGDRIHQGTLESAPFKDETFDVIVLNHSLEHMFSPVKSMQRVWDLLKPSGIAVVAVPNVESVEAKLFGPSWVHWDPPRHLYHFGRATLTRVLEEAGFRVDQCRTSLGTYFFMVSLERFWTSKYGRKPPSPRLVEKTIITPLCMLVGHLGYGTEIKVYARKGSRR